MPLRTITPSTQVVGAFYPIQYDGDGTHRTNELALATITCSSAEGSRTNQIRALAMKLVSLKQIKSFDDREFIQLMMRLSVFGREEIQSADIAESLEKALCNFLDAASLGYSSGHLEHLKMLLNFLRTKGIVLTMNPQGNTLSIYFSSLVNQSWYDEKSDDPTIQIIRMVLESPQIQFTAHGGPYSLAGIVTEAASHGSVEAIKCILSDPRLEKIPAQGRFGVGEMVYRAATTYNTEGYYIQGYGEHYGEMIIIQLAQNPEFQHIPIGGPSDLSSRRSYTLFMSLYVAASNWRVSIFATLLNLSKERLTPEFLNALIDALLDIYRFGAVLEIVKDPLLRQKVDWSRFSPRLERYAERFQSVTSGEELNEILSHLSPPGEGQDLKSNQETLEIECARLTIALSELQKMETPPTESHLRRAHRSAIKFLKYVIHTVKVMIHRIQAEIDRLLHREQETSGIAKTP